MSPITLAQELINPIKSAMDMSGAINLPFAAPYIWVKNGDTRMKQQGGIHYFGGWASNQLDFDAVLQDTSRSLPAGFAKTELVTENGDSIPVYAARNVLFAPIATRRAWVKDRVRQSDYFDGARQHVQMLVYLAEKRGEKDHTEYAPWGPAVLTAKGFQAQNLINAVGAWEKHTRNIRTEIAAGIPAYFFYLSAGTFGSEIKTKSVGGGNAKSTITPIEPYLSDKISAELMTKLFVGDIVAALMVDLQAQANEWLTAWKTPSIDTLGHDRVDSDIQPPDNNLEEMPF